MRLAKIVNFHDQNVYTEVEVGKDDVANKQNIFQSSVDIWANRFWSSRKFSLPILHPILRSHNSDQLYLTRKCAFLLNKFSR